MKQSRQRSLIWIERSHQESQETKSQLSEPGRPQRCHQAQMALLQAEDLQAPKVGCQLAQKAAQKLLPLLKVLQALAVLPLSHQPLPQQTSKSKRDSLTVTTSVGEMTPVLSSTILFRKWSSSQFSMFPDSSYVRQESPRISLKSTLNPASRRQSKTRAFPFRLF